MHPYLNLIPKYFAELSEKQLAQFEQQWGLYHEWNSMINVISRKDIDELYLRHVLHSLSIAKVFKFHEKTKVLDVGTGGGFPGIPLSIYFPEVEFTLIDSIGKKIKVVNEVINRLEIHNAEGIQIRAEDVKGQFDIVVSRAVTQLPRFVSLVSRKIKRGISGEVSNGIIYLKGGNLEKELNSVPWTREVHNISDFFDEDFFETKKIVHLIKG